MIWILRGLAALSVVVSLLFYGLSAMASDDVGRAHEARTLQAMVLGWVVLSIATPFAAALLGRGDRQTEALAYLPLGIVALVSVVWMVRF